MSKVTKPKCAASVWHGFGFSKCRYNAVIDGYCKIHHPPTVEARRKARHAKWQRQLDAKMQSRAIAEAAETERVRRAECFFALVEALEEARLQIEYMKFHQGTASCVGVLAIINAALAQAKGEK